MAHPTVFLPTANEQHPPFGPANRQSEFTTYIPNRACSRAPATADFLLLSGFPSHA